MTRRGRGSPRDVDWVSSGWLGSTLVLFSRDDGCHDSPHFVFRRGPRTWSVSSGHSRLRQVTEFGGSGEVTGSPRTRDSVNQSSHRARLLRHLEPLVVTSRFFCPSLLVPLVRLRVPDTLPPHPRSGISRREWERKSTPRKSGSFVDLVPFRSDRRPDSRDSPTVRGGTGGSVSLYDSSDAIPWTGGGRRGDQGGPDKEGPDRR